MFMIFPGDNHASWQDLAQSVIDVLNFQLYSIPLVGADICGFGGMSFSTNNKEPIQKRGDEA